MKIIAVLISLVIIIVCTVMLWAQDEPNNFEPASPFHAIITYDAGCYCSLNDRVDFIWEKNGSDYRFAVHCTTGTGHVTTANLTEGWYDIHFLISSFSGCDSTVALRVWHPGTYIQDAYLDVYP